MLNNKNISNYFNCLDIGGNHVELNVSDGVDEFIVTAYNSFIGSQTYLLASISDKVRIIEFNGEKIDSSVTKITFTINK